MPVDFNITGDYLKNGVPIGGGDGLKGIHSIITLASGGVTNVNLTPTPSTNSVFITNRIIAYPFIPNQTITISNLYMNVAAATAGSLCRIAIYNDLNGLPNTSLFVSSDLDCSTSGIKTALSNFTFTAGVTYWLAFHGNGAGSTIAFIQLSSTLPIRPSSTLGSMANSYFSNKEFTAGTPQTFTTPSVQSTIIPFIGITKQ
jgi:hypothetical protein